MAENTAGTDLRTLLDEPHGVEPYVMLVVYGWWLRRRFRVIWCDDEVALYESERTYRTREQAELAGRVFVSGFLRYLHRVVTELVEELDRGVV